MSDVLIELCGNNSVSSNDIGEPEASESVRKIYAERQSVGLTEFYQAGTIGLKPELVFVIYRFEYNGEKTVIYGNKKYNVIRVADVKSNKDKIKLVCNSVAGDYDADSKVYHV